MAITTATAGSTRDDRERARLALSGDGDAFAELYDRHERRVYGFCLRMLGGEDDAAEATQETFVRLLRRLPALEGREVNFVAYALTTARNVCYDTIRARRRVEPVGEPIEPAGPEPGALELDPERAALLAATRETVRMAHARLPDRQREVLALRELEQLSYEEIGAVVDLNANGVAQLISRARIRLRDLVNGGELASIAAASPECERALPLLAKLQDDELGEGAELAWVRDHLGDCETCRLSRAAMQEAGVSYRALGPIVVVAWLRHATIARAAELVGVDWSHVAEGHGSIADSNAVEGSSGGGHDEPDDRPAASPPGLRRLRRRLVALAVACALLALVLSTSLARDAHIRELKLQPGTPQASPSIRPRTPAFAAANRRRSESRVKRRSRAPALAALTGTTATASGQPTAPGQPVTAMPTPTANRHAGRHHAARHPSAPTGPPPVSTVPVTTTTTPAPAPPSVETPASTPTTPTETTSTPTSPGAPGGPPPGGGGAECPPTALAC
ncbi:MAG TPA: sigma-70 family RNA polymerase sigma factor [Solirubrobacteraceae bacterium]|jgi:RNA polymerase sigma factor (sigma-70 family)|nr:sigma-70 family RNA polymerase sigma factor [Solirubrobacteraceae bacterium]